MTLAFGRDVPGDRLPRDIRRFENASGSIARQSPPLSLPYRPVPRLAEREDATTYRKSPDFQQGYEDGCASANQQGADLRNGQVAGRGYTYKADDAYRTGWSNGFSSARDDEYARGHSSGVQSAGRAAAGHALSGAIIFYKPCNYL